MKSSVSLQRITLILLSVLFLQTSLFAAVIPEKAASRIAGDFVFWNPVSRSGAATLRLSHVVKSGGTDRIYIYNVDGGGWVMVSGDDNTRRDVLGYSTTGNFDYSALPVNARNWIEGYADVIAQLESHPEYIRRDSVMPSRAMGGSVSPLLDEIAWDQGEPYNLLCPELGNGERAVTGCVATAMAQVMMYYRYPEAGTGRVSYEWRGQTLSAELGKYDWNLMAPKYTGNESEASREAVAKLMRDCGYSVKMDYGFESGANFYNSFTALVENFKYDKSLIYFPRNSCDTESWERIIKEELDNRRPVLYSGTGNGGAHAFVCDGYDDKGYFHFNWGWSGYNDGYFITGENLYPYSQSMIYGIQPEFGGKGRASLVIDYLTIRNKEVMMTGKIYSSYTESQFEIGYALESKLDGAVTIRPLNKINTVVGYIEYHFNPEISGLSDGEYILYPVVCFEGEKNWSKTSFLPYQFPMQTDRYIEFTVKDGLLTMPEISWMVNGIQYRKYLAGTDGGIPIENLEVIDAEIGDSGELYVPATVKVGRDEFEVTKVSFNEKNELVTLSSSSPELQLELQGCSNLKTIKFDGAVIWGGCDSPNLENILLTENLYKYDLYLYDTNFKKIDFPIKDSGLQINGWSLPDSVKIYLHSTIPPIIKKNEIRNGVEFHVPSGTEDIYLSAGFGKLGTVIEEEYSVGGKYNVEWGMCGDYIPNSDYSSGIDIGDGNNNVELAVKFNRLAAQTYKGKKITAINYYSTGDDIGYVFISDSDKGYITKQRITTVAGIINRIILEEPYVITGEPIYFGFGNVQKTGIGFAALDREIEDHFYIRLIGDDMGLCNIPPNRWVYYGKSLPLPITITIEGEDMPVGASILNMEIQSVKESSHPNLASMQTESVESMDGDGIYLINNTSERGRKIEKIVEENVPTSLSRVPESVDKLASEVKLFGDSCRVKVFLQNRSPEKITSFKLRANAGNRTFDKNFTHSLAMNQSAHISFSFPIKDLDDNFELRASVAEVNGNPDVIPDDGVTTASVMNCSRSETYPLRIVVEKATSASKYDYFEDYLNKIEKEWPDNYLGINIHYNDEMANPENYQTLTRWISSDYPWMITSRMTENSYIEFVGWPQMSSYFMENVNMATESVKITKAVTNGKKCEVSAVVSAAYPASGKSFALAFVVLEDNVGPYPKLGYNSEVNELFDNVARGIYGDFNGVTGLLPEKMDTNVLYPVTYSFTMPKNIDNLDNTKIVALLLDENIRNYWDYPVIANADRMKLEIDKNLSGVIEMTVDADDIIKVEGNRILTTVTCDRLDVFTIDGKKTVSENLAKGFYVVRGVVNGRTFIKKIVI